MALFESLSALIGTKTAAAATGLVLAGGAAAGAADQLPDPLQNAFDAVTQADSQELPAETDGNPELPDEANGGQAEGQELPDEADGGEGELPEDLPEESRADEVHEAIDSTEPGAERGAAVSEAASGDAGSQGDAAREADTANADRGDDQGTESDEGEQPEELPAGDVPAEGEEGASHAEEGQGAADVGADNAEEADEQPEEGTSDVPGEGQDGADNAEQRGEDRP